MATSPELHDAHGVGVLAVISNETERFEGTSLAHYQAQIPPALYRFHVIASNNDGVWNEQGATELQALRVERSSVFVPKVLRFREFSLPALAPPDSRGPLQEPRSL